MNALNPTCRNTIRVPVGAMLSVVVHPSAPEGNLERGGSVPLRLRAGTGSSWTGGDSAFGVGNVDVVRDLFADRREIAGIDHGQQPFMVGHDVVLIGE